MTAQVLLSLDFARWETWVALTAGVAFTGLILIFGHMLLSGARRPAPLRDSRLRHAIPHSGASSVDRADDRRRSPRREGASIRVLLAADGEQAHVVEGWVLDRSLGGLGIRTDQRVVVGKQLHLRPADASEGVPWVPVEVRYCRSEKNYWRLGCQFVEAPASRTMVQFG